MNNWSMEGTMIKVLAATLISLSLLRLHRRLREARHKLTPCRPHQPRILTRSTSREAARNSQSEGLPSTSLAPYRLSLFFCARSIAHKRWEGHIRTRRAERMAYDPLGQTLIVTDSTGWIQQWGGSIQEIRKGDVVSIPPGVKHWHGATASTSMTHIAIQESLNGRPSNGWKR